MSRILFLAVVLCFSCSIGAAAETVAESPPTSLDEFVARPEPAYRWSVAASTPTGQGTVHSLHLVSQTWQGIVWEHALQVYEPEAMKHPGHVLLFITGGKNGGMPREGEVAMGLQLAQRCGARVAMLHQVPNQPLLGDRVEDDLITETWLRYLETGDESWPLLFPMVKSAVKAMDAVQEFVKSTGGEIEGFVVTGASKRGWTSWLTAAADERIIATAPIVINTLNFPEQMKYQIETWGEYSEQIADYTSKGLVRPEGEPRTDREKKLWRMMDPFIYRGELTLPKLLIVGTNDRYWVVDAMNLYWDELEGPKYALQVPNAGHGLDDGRDAALTTLAVFFRHSASETALPVLDWKHSNSDGQMNLTMSADPPPKEVRLWTASSATKDFRESTWTSQPVEGTEGRFESSVKTPADGHAAVFGEFRYEFEGLDYSLTTQAYRN